ncbi:MAG: hypothetical protein VB066_01830 [Paludibacter sp.]|nr:hypothetical protein [Paludibacter sp.]
MEDNLKDKRQQFHLLLIALGEVKYKEVIVEGMFPGIESTMSLNEQQLDRLIADATNRMGNRGQDVKRRPISPANAPEEYQIKQLRNKCLQVLTERGIKSTPKDWTAVNKELEAPRYQWVLSEEQRAAGVINKRGIGTFNTVESLKKLFYQLCAIRDNERVIKTKIAERISQN